ncbi:unnamed protein product [Lactuca saligna]|uniref:Uncharacterized protein n=1 Tax=Lactuca saligna TaxID=75948 RepID=A0AA35VL18_LACSI|nr:unnamed protein product [Lactuca saligna]
MKTEHKKRPRHFIEYLVGGGQNFILQILLISSREESILMKSNICSPSSSHSCLPSLHHNPTPSFQSWPNYKPFSSSPLFSPLSIQSTFTSPKSSIPAVTPTEGSIPVINFEDFVEKDWSFLDADDISSNQVYKQNTDQIISSGKISEDSKVLISTGSEGFVHKVIDIHSCKQLKTMCFIQHRFDPPFQTTSTLF